MGRSPCCTNKEGMKRGAWTALEDKILTDYVAAHGEGKWRSIPKNAGLERCGKSCRLRWLNYLRPDIKRGNITQDEEDLIIRLHRLLGNRWSLIAGRLPGRTDNEIKNYWNSYLAKRVRGEHKISKHDDTSNGANCAKKAKIPTPGPQLDTNHVQPVLSPPGAAVPPPSALALPLPLPAAPVVSSGCTIDGDAVNDILPVSEYESSNVSSSPSMSKEDLSTHIVDGALDGLNPDLLSFDEFSFSQFDLATECDWSSLQQCVGEVDISQFGSWLI